MMKKAVLTTLICLSFAGNAFASAPATNLGQGQFEAGYSYESLATNGNFLGDMGTFQANGLQAAYGIGNNLSVTGSYLASNAKNPSPYYYPGYNNFKFDSTELGLQYQVTPNIAVSVGNVKSGFTADGGSNTTNETYGGIALKANLANRLDGYAAYLKSNHVQDWKAGVQYAVSRNASVDVGYHDYQDNNDGISAKGVTAGVNYRF